MQQPIRFQTKPYIVPPCKQDYRLLHQDAQLLVVFKPAGLLSQPGHLKENQDSLLTRLKGDYATPYLIHRLDLDTSGVMVVALSKMAAGQLGKLFEQRQVQKNYIALVDGLLESSQGTIDLPLAADNAKRPLQKVCFEIGKSAKTEYQVIDRDTANQRTRIKLMPFSGRTHQLRVHMAAIGHAIIGCDMYASDSVCYAGKRLMLHAESLSFMHPNHLQIHDKKPFYISCPPEF